MKAKDLLAAVNIDFQYLTIHSFLLEESEKLYPITNIQLQNDEMIFVAGSGKPLELRDIITHLMLHKNWSLYKQRKNIVPIYGYQIDQQRIIL